MNIKILLLTAFSIIGINLNAQNCGVLDSVSSVVVDNGNGTSNYTFVGYFSTTSGGNKSVDITIYSGSHYFVTNDCVPTGSSQSTKTYGPYTNITTLTGTIFIDWIGKTTNNCGGSTCGGEIGVTPELPLPVEMLSFTAKAHEESVVLNWKTASEVNNDRFEVLRSVNGSGDFEYIGLVDGNGTTNSIMDYEFVDRQIAQMNVNKVCYRLLQIDFDGESEMTDIECVDLNQPDATVIYPNPASNRIYVDFIETEETTTVEILSVEGKVIQRKTVLSGDQCSIDMSNVSNGVYVVKVSNSTRTTSSRVIVNH